MDVDPLAPRSQRCAIEAVIHDHGGPVAVHHLRFPPPSVNLSEHPLTGLELETRPERLVTLPHRLDVTRLDVTRLDVTRLADVGYFGHLVAICFTIASMIAIRFVIGHLVADNR
jgi:hypothetical protein